MHHCLRVAHGVELVINSLDLLASKQGLNEHKNKEQKIELLKAGLSEVHEPLI